MNSNYDNTLQLICFANISSLPIVPGMVMRMKTTEFIGCIQNLLASLLLRSIMVAVTIMRSIRPMDWMRRSLIGEQMNQIV